MDINLIAPTTPEEKHVLNITITPADYNPQIDKEAKKYAKTVNIKGFRPGQAPIELVRKMIAKDMKQDVVINLLYKSIDDYFEKNNIQIIGHPIPTENTPAVNFDTQNEFFFSYYVGVVDNFEIDLQKINIDNYEIALTEDFIQTQIKRFQTQLGEIVTADDVADATSVKIELAVVYDEQGYNGEGDFNLGDFKPETLEKLKALPIGDKLTDTLDNLFLNVYLAGDMLGLPQKAQHENPNPCEITLKNWLKIAPHEINGAFFDKLDDEEVTNYDELYEKIKEQSQRVFDENVFALKFRQVQEQLSDAVDEITYSESFLKDLLERNNTETEEEEEEVKELEETDTENATETQEEKEAKRFESTKKMLKNDLIIEKLAKSQNITISKEEVYQKAYTDALRYMGEYANDERFRKMMSENIVKTLSENQSEFNRVAFELKTEKVIRYIITQKDADLPAPTIISLEDFRKLWDKTPATDF